MTEKNIILDTGAISLFFTGGKLGEQVKPYFDAVSRKKRAGWIHETTLTEFEYKACQVLEGEKRPWIAAQVEKGVIGKMVIEIRAGFYETPNHPEYVLYQNLIYQMGTV